MEVMYFYSHSINTKLYFVVFHRLNRHFNVTYTVKCEKYSDKRQVMKKGK